MKEIFIWTIKKEHKYFNSNLTFEDAKQFIFLSLPKKKVFIKEKEWNSSSELILINKLNEKLN